MKKNYLPLTILIFFTVILFKNNGVIQQSILEGCHLFITRLFPSLFPMMILCDCLVFFGLPELLCKVLGPCFSKLFHVSSYGAFAFVMSFFSGSPANAYLIKNLYQKHYLTEEEASKILSFAFFSNPLFLYTMLGLLFERRTLIWLLFLLPYFVNIGIGIFSKKDFARKEMVIKREKESFGTMLSSSIKNAMNTNLLILGSVCLFFIINTVFNPFHQPIFTGFLEISQGLNQLVTLSCSLKAKALMATFFISFGGLSIHLQIKGILSDTPISYLQFLKGRIKQALISFFLLFFLL